MSEALDNLQRQEHLVRYLLEQPSTLKPSKVKAVRVRAMDAIQAASYMRGYFAGEFAGCTDNELKKHLDKGHAHYAEQLGAPLRLILGELTKHVKSPKRPKPGRPAGSMKPIANSYLYVISAHLGSGKSLPECVRAAAKDGLIDPKIADTTHIRKVERYYQMIRKKFAEPAGNVVKFPNRRRTKITK